MKKLLLLGYAREGSTRVKNKMLRQFNGNTLFNLYMEKFENINKYQNPFSNIKMAICKNDKNLWDMAKSYNVDIIERSEYSAKASIDKDCKKVYHYLKNVEEANIMWVNGCFPFLTESTINNIGRYFVKRGNVRGLHCVKQKYSWIWDIHKRSIINSENIGKISTVHFKPYLESVHCCHIYNKNYLLNYNSYWPFTKDNPYLYDVEDTIEFMDIDTEMEFKYFENIWKSRK